MKRSFKNGREITSATHRFTYPTKFDVRESIEDNKSNEKDTHAQKESNGKHNEN